MKKLVCSLLICAVALVTGLHAQSVADLAKIKFVGVKSMRIAQVGDQRIAYVKLQIANSSSSELVIADGDYTIKFRSAEMPKEKDAEPVFVDETQKLPATPTKESILPKGSLMSAGVGTVEVAVAIGQIDVPATNDNLIKLFNLAAGEHQRLVQVVLDGRLRFGVNVGKATAFQTQDIRWVLTPKAMDRVIFSE